MSIIWVLVADSSRARIFAADTPKGPLQELETLAHPQSRLHERDLTTDLPGRTFDSAGQGRHAMEQKTSPKHEEAISFARQISEQLDSARIAGKFGKLMLVAAPAFLGLLREHLSAETMKQVTAQLDKDFTTLDAAALRNRLPERL